MVYFMMQLKKLVIPAYSDLFLVGIFALFYIGNYYIQYWLSNLLNVYTQELTFTNLTFFALFHTVIFGLIQILIVKVQRGRS